ncbi:hypothetical protein [Microbacterium sp.]|uniref:hypothetical protein n=1 Tax=Microbacterium sp. TaxID=51671 RepID=UPI0025D57376|nr:hypothetical protein [Microbacterium sp.]MBT9606340.1 hypothetical protein [Microbacterium sp.]
MNFLSVAVAVLAILMLLGVGSFALVQRATANPADSAMASLREREAELANEISRAQTAAELYEASREQAAASASAAADVLESLDGTIEPETLAAAQAARLSLERVASTPIDASVPKYTRATIGEKSFQQVARAINTAQGLQDSLPELMTEVRRARADVMAASAEFNASMRKVAASLERIATARLSDTAASAPFLDAVSAATARVRDAQGAGGDGLTQIRDLVSALEALTSESERVLTERRDATDRSAPAPNAPQFGTPPVVEPTEPSPVPSPQEASPPAEPPPAPNPSPSSSDPGEGETG